MDYTYQELLQGLNRLKNKSLMPDIYEELINSISNKQPEELVSIADYNKYLNLLDEEYTDIFKCNKVTEDEDLFYSEDPSLNDMFNDISIFNNLQQAYKMGDKYTIIPILNRKAYIVELGRLFLKTNIELDNYVLISKVFKEVNKKTITRLRETPMNEYLGDQQYMYDRCSAIEEGIGNLYAVSPEKEKISTIAKNCISLIARIKRLCLNTNIKPEEYLELSSLFQELLKIETDLRPIVKEEWDKYFQENDVNLIHTLSSAKIESKVMVKICTSIKTTDFNTIFYGHIGYEYGPNYDHIISICPNDSGSWQVRKDEFIGPWGIRTKWQFGNKHNIFYEIGKQSTLYLPDKLIEEGKKHNYTEVIFMDSNHEIRPLKAFYTDEATEEEINTINQLAEKQNIPVEYIDTKLTENIRKGM